MAANIATAQIVVLDDDQGSSAGKPLQLKVNGGGCAGFHRAEAGLDVVIDAVGLVDLLEVIDGHVEHIGDGVDRRLPH